MHSRGEAAKEIGTPFRHAGEALDRGYAVLVIPEGHRPPDGHLQAFRPESACWRAVAAVDCRWR